MSDRKLPDGWRWVQLDEICRDISDGTHFTPEYLASGVPFLSVKDIRQTGISFADCRFISEEQHQKFCKRCKPERGDVLYTKVGTTGIAKAVDTDREFSIFVSVALLKLKPNVLPEYTEYVLNAPVCRAQAENLTQGMANRNLVIRDIKSIKIPLPPLPEQRRIAAILTEQMAAVEQARAAAEAELAAAEKLTAAYLREVFESEEAQGWPQISIKLLGREGVRDVVQTGPFGAQLPSSEFTNYGVPVLNIGNVQWGYLDLSRLNYVSEEKANQLARYKLQEGDLLFTRSGTVGRSTVVPPEVQNWLMSYHLLRVDFDRNRVNPYFAYAAIRGSADVLAQIHLASGRGATRDGVNTTILSEIRIPIPAKKVQDRIIDSLDKKVPYIDYLCRTVSEKLSTLDGLPTALLRRAFNGEL